MTKRSVPLSRLLAPVGLLAAAGIISGVLQGSSGAAESRPRMSVVADPAAVSAPSAPATSAPSAAAAPTATATAAGDPSATPSPAPSPTPTPAPAPVADEALRSAADRRFGLTATTGGADGYWGLTATTAADQAQLLCQVFTGDSILSPASRGYVQQLLGQVESDQRWGVSAAATGGTSAVKDGWLPRDADGLWVINSIGTVEHDGHQLLIAVLSDGNADESGGIALVESVAQAAAGSLNGS
ncbi:hypothetical protein ACFWXO_11310 [Kitasatospora sp. NPDC059088]|uniref:hypothetical protein n=1 Tax=Kitasatospora sp. NPDC059088 TaxID=3346722 RepID=UPI0036A3E1D4